MSETYGKMNSKGTVMEEKGYVSIESFGRAQSNDLNVERTLASRLVDFTDQTAQIAYSSHKRD